MSIDDLRVDDWEQMTDVNIESNTRKMKCVFS